MNLPSYKTMAVATGLAALVLVAVLPSLQARSSAQMTVSSLTGPPIPADFVPPSEAIGGAIGVDTAMYARSDHTHPRITRVAVVSTDASGNWAVTWSTPLAATPAVFPIAVNAGSLPVTCNVTARSTTAASGKCWGAQSALLNLSIITAGLTLTPDVAVGAGVSVQVVAIPATQ